ncbi:FhaA domain-containing protein [Microbacterium sp. NPDC089696]|uniref:FhaA domain-containing protein n=1 Tax=Microbacterium sp. NPDC089696 TaxID=3364199 RepID=UPI0037F71B4C
MGLLDSFEKGLERAVNSAFAKTFRSGIQPVEIASALRREADTKAAVVSRDRIIAPNSYVVRLSADDYERMQGLGGALTDELHALLTKHAKSQGYSFAGPLAIALEADDIATGTVRVSSGTVEGRVNWQAVIDVDGRRHPLTRARTVIGRGTDADITIADAGSSRKHVEILWDGERAMMRDLGSTNGTKVDGAKVREAGLPTDTTLTIGRTDLVFRIVPVATPSRPAHPRDDDATRAFGAI